MRYVRWAAGLALFVLLLLFPAAAANGAREAMAQWYHTVAPSLFPFMALMPLLTGAEARDIYERLFGGTMRFAFDLPGSCAPALAVGMLAGSPAGSAAVRRAACGGGMTRGQVERLAMACCGLSPGFLITGVGAAMLGSAALGHLLLRAQVLTQLAMLFGLRFVVRDDRPAPIPDGIREDSRPISPAVRAVLSVGGWMALFGALAGVAGAAAGERAGTGLRCVMEIGTGARAISALGIDGVLKLALLSAAAGFGGLCIALQNLSVLAACGVSRARFLLARLAAGGLSAGLTVLQLVLKLSLPAHAAPSVLRLSCLGLCAALLPVIFRMKRMEA